MAADISPLYLSDVLGQDVRGLYWVTNMGAFLMTVTVYGEIPDHTLYLVTVADYEDGECSRQKIVCNLPLEPAAPCIADMYHGDKDA